MSNFKTSYSHNTVDMLLTSNIIAKYFKVSGGIFLFLFEC